MTIFKPSGEYQPILSEQELTEKHGADVVITSYNPRTKKITTTRQHIKGAYEMTNPSDATIDMISDAALAEVFAGTNFGASKPREIVAETLLKIAGGFSSGNTALECCQELGLVGKNKIHPQLTRTGRKYLYYAHKPRAYQSTAECGQLEPSQREKLAEEIAAYFAGYSFSRHEWKQCLGLVDVLLVRGYKINPPSNKE
jgi:hypothetical protein